MEALLNTRVDCLKPLLCKEVSLPVLAQKLKKTELQLKRWLQDLLQQMPLKIAQNSFIIRKDPLGKYLWYNSILFDLSQTPVIDLVGKTDFDLAEPKKAKAYRDCDVKAMITSQRQKVIEKVQFCYLGFYDAVAEIIPVVDEKGASDGVILFAHLDFKLNEQPFAAALRLIRSPREYGLMRYKSYDFTVEGRNVSLSQKEAEVTLGMLVGLSSSELGEKMSISSRTVETYFVSVKNKLGETKKASIIELLLNSDFLSLI